MMRIFLLILFLSCQSIYAQKYTIIHVIGKIYDSSTSKYLKSGSKLTEASKLKFVSPNARAAALSSSRGRYVIQKKAAQGSSSDLAYTLSSVLAPARGKMSTRAGGINNQMDFVKKFGEGPIAIVNESYTASISSTSYPTDDSRFFYASYIFNGESINKKLEVIDEQLIFNTRSFYSVDDITIDPAQTSEATLFYYDANKEESAEITTLEFAVIGQDELINIKNSLGEISQEDQITSIQEIVSSLYGTCSEDQIKEAMKRLN